MDIYLVCRNSVAEKSSLKASAIGDDFNYERQANAVADTTCSYILTMMK